MVEHADYVAKALKNAPDPQGSRVDMDGDDYHELAVAFITSPEFAWIVAMASFEQQIARLLERSRQAIAKADAARAEAENEGWLRMDKKTQQAMAKLLGFS